MDELYKEVGGRIRGVRRRTGLTQERLADQLRISRPSIANIETGKQKLQLHTIFEIAVALGVSPRELIFPPESSKPGEMLDPFVLEALAYESSEDTNSASR